MKKFAFFLLFLTTLLLIALTVLSALNFPFTWVFYLTVSGQCLLIYTVYSLLTDTYTTDKTFDDFYEDNPIGQWDPHS